MGAPVGVFHHGRNVQERIVGAVGLNYPPVRQRGEQKQKNEAHFSFRYFESIEAAVIGILRRGMLKFLSFALLLVSASAGKLCRCVSTSFRSHSLFPSRSTLTLSGSLPDRSQCYLVRSSLDRTLKESSDRLQVEKRVFFRFPFFLFFFFFFPSLFLFFVHLSASSSSLVSGALGR